MIQCPHCGQPANPALTVHVPGCGGSLRNSVREDAPSAERSTTPPASHAPTGAAGAVDPEDIERRCNEPGCGGTLPAGAVHCPLCETPVAHAWVLVFPTAERVVERLPMVLGRDPARSPLAELCSGHDNVSRVHAEIVSSGDGLAVRDLRSTNGTFLNDATVGHRPLPLADGDIVRLGADLRVEVRHA